MSLFSSKEVSPGPKVASQAQSAKLTTNLVATLGPTLKELKECVSMLTPHTLIHFHTSGKWHRHQLITYLLNQTGPADLYMSSWSMSEDPVRALYMLKKRGMIKSAHLIISERINERTPEVMQLARNVFDRIKFEKLHAKITLLQGEQMSVVVIGSANLTRNPKEEAGVIDTSPVAIEFWKNWMDNELSRINN